MTMHVQESEDLWPMTLKKTWNLNHAPRYCVLHSCALRVLDGVSHVPPAMILMLLIDIAKCTSSGI